jgi:tetratricopeptide (TPR) repeat protein
MNSTTVTLKKVTVTFFGPRHVGPSRCLQGLPMLGFLFKKLRRHPKTALLAAVAVGLAASAAGVYLYAHQQWRHAQTAVQEARYQDAQMNLQRCLFFWPRDVQVRVLAARACRLTGDFDGAEMHLNQCLKLQRGASEEVQLEFLLMRVQRGEIGDVLPILMEMVDNQHPESAMILEVCSGAFIYNHRYRPALSCLDRWVAVAPQAALPHQWRGWVYEHLSAREDAMNEYRKALDLDPDLTAVRLRLVEMLLNEKHPIEALPHLKRLQARFPDRADIRARLGQCRFLQGEFEEARKLLTGAVAELPNDQQLLLHLGKLELQDGNAKEAETWLRRAVEADIGDPEPQLTLSSCLAVQLRRKEADEWLDKSLKTKAVLEKSNRMLREEAESPSRDAKTVCEIGSLLLQIGQNRLALHWLHEALNRDPNYQPAHKLLVEYYESQKDEEKAALHRRLLNKSDRPSSSEPQSPGKSPVGNR